MRSTRGGCAWPLRTQAWSAACSTKGSGKQSQAPRTPKPRTSLFCTAGPLPQGGPKCTAVFLLRADACLSGRVPLRLGSPGPQGNAPALGSSFQGSAGPSPRHSHRSPRAPTSLGLASHRGFAGPVPCAGHIFPRLPSCFVEAFPSQSQISHSTPVYSHVSFKNKNFFILFF